jgi:formiminoglutamase
VKLPLLLSVPHGGLGIPPEVKDYCVLTEEEVRRDGDEGAAEIYDLEAECEGFAAAGVARAIVDLNRAEDDRRRDGVVKTHTCWDVPVYDPFPPEGVVRELLDRYYRPYHERLSRLSEDGVILGIDCHTMAAAAPPIGPDPGRERPALCLSSAEGTLPDEWLLNLAGCLRETFGTAPSLNDPFRGGHIIRSHAGELPWVQLEVSRAPTHSLPEKRERVLGAFRRFCSRI